MTATKRFKALLATAVLGCSGLAQATIVEVTTNLGKFEINLYDESTPVTVQNFLNYVSSERYNGTVIHRSEPGFVIQRSEERRVGKECKALESPHHEYNRQKLYNITLA